MAKYLYKLGNWAAKHGKSVVFSTLGILVILGVLAGSLGSSFNDELTIPGTPADKASKLLKEEFPESQSTGAQVKIIFKAPEDQTLDSEQINKVITDTLSNIQKDDSNVESVATPVQLKNLTEDKTMGYAVVNYKNDAKDIKESSKKNVLNKIEQTRDKGIQTELTGDVKFTVSESHGESEVIGILIAFLILAITFASFLAAGMPIITAIIGLGIGMLGVTIGSNYIEFQNVSLSLSTMLGIAVGIDYALFIITRFRQQLGEGHTVKESIAIATGTAGSAVVFAGITVIIGLLGLSVMQIPFLTMMGVAASISVLCAVLVSIIVLPAILGMIGHRFHPSKRNKFLKKITGAKEGKVSSNKWGEFVTKHPLVISLVAIALLAVISIPFFHMNLGLPDDGDTMSKDATERKAYDLMTEAYGEGVHSTLVVAAKVDSKKRDPQEIQKEVAEFTKEISELKTVKSVTPAFPNSSGEVYIITVTPKTGPNDIETKDLVKHIREKSDTTKKENGIELLVTGTTAVNIDMTEKLNQALPIFAVLVVGLAYVLLVLVFRSILLPLKAVLGFLLSLAATIGFVVYVIQDGNLLDLFGFPSSSPILAFLPILTIGILFGLAMDYEVFLASRMREVYTHTGNPKEAILAGIRDSGKVVAAAGLIMIAVFFGFMLMPDPMVKAIGMSLAFGVIFDAFVVRLTIVPAVMTLMGKAAWYMPKWLDKILPNIDVEGESILHKSEGKDKKVG
ncbi:MMPL family transporter [Bacillus sp. MMSF_3353]|uniref:MMPL family transporter n=1 Tax=Bacillus sp. MMSF_3353 TaxID=3047081 RepID=UPI00353153D2